MRQDCVSIAGETMYGCTSAFFVCSSKNHVSLADLVMVGPGKLMVGHGPPSRPGSGYATVYF